MTAAMTAIGAFVLGAIFLYGLYRLIFVNPTNPKPPATCCGGANCKEPIL